MSNPVCFSPIFHVCNGLLKLLHERKYVYLDIKPKNIIKFKNKKGNYLYSFIDLENFVKLPLSSKYMTKHLNSSH